MRKYAIPILFLFIGLAAGRFMVKSAGPATATGARVAAQPETRPASDPIGRYQVVVNQNMPLWTGTFLVDSQTGKVWSLMRCKSLDWTPFLWIPQDRVDDNGQL